jgi:glycosyltransferase involved in cell wall biosynthesis
VERIEQILEDRELQARLGRQASSYARTFDWSLIADQILELYSMLVPRLA